MKKKMSIFLLVALAVTAISVSAVFANGNGEQGEKSAVRSMFDAMRSWSQQSQDNGEITQEEAKEWDNHFNSMEKYHGENGVDGHCGGINNVNGNAENQNYMSNNRSGMMGSFSNNRLQ